VAYNRLHSGEGRRSVAHGRVGPNAVIVVPPSPDHHLGCGHALGHARGQGAHPAL